MEDHLGVLGVCPRAYAAPLAPRSLGLSRLLLSASRVRARASDDMRCRLEAFLLQAERQAAVIVAGRLEADDDRGHPSPLSLKDSRKGHRRSLFCVMIHVVRLSQTQRNGGDGLSPFKDRLCTLLWAPCSGGFRRRGYLVERRGAAAIGGRPPASAWPAPRPAPSASSCSGSAPSSSETQGASACISQAPARTRPVPPCCRKAQARIAPRQDGTKTTIRSTSAAFGLAKNCQNPPVNTGKTPPSPRRHPKLRQRQAKPPAKQNRQQSRKTSYFTIVRDQSGPGSVPSSATASKRFCISRRGSRRNEAAR